MRCALSKKEQPAGTVGKAASPDHFENGDKEPSHAEITAALSPAGAAFTQKTAHRFADLDHLILLCGHYEGMDERIYRHVDEEVSIGDFILTGGELAAMAVADAVIRLLPGAIRSESTGEESFENGLLEYPQYTQPAVYDGESVPDVLLSGNHEKIRVETQGSLCAKRCCAGRTCSRAGPSRRRKSGSSKRSAPKRLLRQYPSVFDPEGLQKRLDFRLGRKFRGGRAGTAGGLSGQGRPFQSFPFGFQGTRR